MAKIRVAVIGVGNCASSLVQGVAYYRSAKAGDRVPGVMHVDLGGYHIRDIEFSAAVDIDRNKVGKDLSEAIFAPPNNTKVFYDKFTYDDVIVQMGNVLDGVAPHMAEYPERQRFVVADRPSAEMVAGGIDPRVLGLYHGVPMTRRSTTFGAPYADTIHLFSANLERVCTTRPALAERIRVTVLHETAHFFGYTERQLRLMGLA